MTFNLQQNLCWTHRREKGQARLPIPFRENMQLIIFSHSQQLSLTEIVLVIIAVIIILIQISNLSKYYPVDAASLLQGYRWRPLACSVCRDDGNLGQGPPTADGQPASPVPK